MGYAGENYSKEIGMKQISDGVFFIPGQDEFIPDSHVYVVGKSTSGDLSIVDAGLMGKGVYKIESMQKLGLSLLDIKRVIMTHTHLDHIGCLKEILEAIPHAELWVHTKEAEPLEQGDERIVYGMDMFRSMCQTQYNIKKDAFKFKIERKLEGDETLEIGNMNWDVIHIPGHSPGSIALYHQPQKILIPGDVVYADYAIGRFDLHGANGPQLKDSLLTLGKLDVTILLPGHNNIVENVKPGYILETANQWAAYLT
jgi:glyoxylase-like metal-dependent hydrolase (beta-lactamase superfamily II)